MKDENQVLWEDIFERSRPKYCVASLEGHCDEELIRAHLIQKALLKNIADKYGKVIQFYHGLQLEKLGSEFVPYISPISVDSSTTWKFTCAHHDKIFSEVEERNPDWENPRHKTLLAYRALLVNDYVKKWLGKATNEYGLYRVSETQREQQRGSEPLLNAIREALISDSYEDIAHVVVPIDARPSIAAAGVILHPNAGTGYSIHSDIGLSVKPSPIAITVLPDSSRQVLLLSYEKEDLLNARDLLDSLEYGNDSIGTAHLSKKILEEMEFIAVSPEAWASFGGLKQHYIRFHFENSMGTTGEEYDISPIYVNLFMPRQG